MKKQSQKHEQPGSGPPARGKPRAEKNARQQDRLRILFICTVNRMRSATAEEIYKDDARFEVRSAGIHPAARVVVSEGLLDWAQLVLVMENRHRKYIRENYPETERTKQIIVLDIPDVYDFMQAELIAALREKVESVIRLHGNLPGSSKPGPV